MATRSKWFSYIFYPEKESLGDLIQCLDANLYDYAISPIHDKDLTDEGEVKKPHYHLIIRCESLKSSLQMHLPLENITIPIIVNNPRRMHRYLIHIDFPNKAQYSFDDIITTYDISQYFESKDETQIVNLLSVSNIIKENNITSYRQLYSVVSDNYINLLPIVMRYAYVYNLLFTQNERN